MTGCVSWWIVKKVAVRPPRETRERRPSPGLPDVYSVRLHDFLAPVLIFQCQRADRALSEQLRPGLLRTRRPGKGKACPLLRRAHLHGRAALFRDQPQQNRLAIGLAAAAGTARKHCDAGA